MKRTDKALWKANVSPKEAVEGFTILDVIDDFICPPKRNPDSTLYLSISDIYTIKGVRQQIIARSVE